MNKETVQNYFFACCDALKIAYKKENEAIYALTLSEELATILRCEPQVQVSFETQKEEEVLYISTESYFLQKLSMLVIEKGHVFSTILRKVDKEEKTEWVYFGYKMSVKTVTFEEEIVYFSYNLQTKEVEEITKEAILDAFQGEQTAFPIPEKVLEEGEEKTLEQLVEKTHAWVDQKKKELNGQLKREIKRIEHYYQLVKKEHENAYTHTSYEDYGIISEEKENLIHNQIVKYQLDEEEVYVEPIFVLYVKDC